jgi:hypothetical protein
MKTTELMAMLKTAEQLGHKDLRIVIDEARDGQLPSYVLLTCELKQIGPQMDPEVALIMKATE